MKELTEYQRLTPERRARKLLTSRLWRERNKEHLKEYHLKRYPSLKAQKRLRIFGDRKCALCGIPLVLEGVGAQRTVKFCGTCSKDKLNKWRYWYKHMTPEQKARRLARSKEYKQRLRQKLHAI